MVGAFCLLVPGTLQAQSKRPRFVHTPPSSPKAGRPLVISGTIVNGADLDYATLKYRKIGTSSSFRSIRLKQKGPSFQVTIPYNVVVAPGFEYYVVGTLFSGRSRVLAGGLANPIQVLVIGGASDFKPPPRRGGSDNNNNLPDDPDNPNKPKSTRVGGGGEKLSRAMTFKSATTQELPIQLAPGTTSIITASDIKNYGWRSLTDVLRNAGGLDINRVGFAPDIGMRGANYLRTGGNGMLFMLDGHDMSFRQMQRNFLNTSWISVDDIERIEIIRGAASGVWGRGAFQGVLNIITKSGQNMRGYSATMGMSPVSGSYFFTARGGDRFKSGLSVYATLSVNQEFRTPTLAPILEFTFFENGFEYVPANDRMLGQNFYFKADYKGLFFTVHQSRYDATVPMNQYSILGADDTNFITDRIIAKVGWDGKLGKTTGLRIWASFDRTTINPDTRITMNPLSPVAGNPPDGRSSQVLLNGAQTAPLCDAVSNPETQCVRIVTVSYQDAEGPKTERACYFNKRSQNPLPTANVEVQAAEKGTVWFPFPTNCQPVGTGGRFQRRLEAEDNRFQLGAQLNVTPTKWLFIQAGLEFEYLQSTLWHFPTVWEQQTEGVTLDNDKPVYGNFRIAAYLQGFARLGKIAAVHAAFRLDYDQRVAASIGPQLGVVVTPGAGVFLKGNYSFGFRTPSLYELFFFEDNRYGNPYLFNETIHSINVQLGWMRKKLLYVALNGYFNVQNDPIRPTQFNSPGNFLGQSGNYVFEYPVPTPTGSFNQLTNRIEGITSLGGEIEARLFPISGFELRGHFGLSIASEVVDADGNTGRVPYSAGLFAGLSATYRYKVFQVSAGVLYVGSKLLPLQSYQVQGQIPARSVNNATGNLPYSVPNWTANEDPRAPTQDDLPRADGYFHLHLTIQLRDLFKHFDIAIRAQNITGLGAGSYDASDPILIPQKRFELLAWLQYNY